MLRALLLGAVALLLGLAPAAVAVEDEMFDMCVGTKGATRKHRQRHLPAQVLRDARHGRRR